MARRLTKKHYMAILSALDADIVNRTEAAYDELGERIDQDVPDEEKIDFEVPTMEEAQSIIKERYGL